MSYRNAIHACLLADSRVTDLIGPDVACRHYPERAPQGPTAPYVVSNEIAGDAHTTHGTEDDTEDTMDEVLLQFTCLAATVAQAEAVRAAVRAALMEDANDILAASHIVVTAPQLRTLNEDEVYLHAAQLDLTVFHNPSA